MKVYLVYTVRNSRLSFGYNCGIGYISSVLRGAGHTVGCFCIRDDAQADSFIDTVREHKPDVVGFSVNHSQLTFITRIVEKIRRVCTCKIVFGGVHPTLDPQVIQVNGVDAVVRGEGEYPMLEYVNAMESESDYSDIMNFWFKEGGQIIKNEVRPLIKDLDSLPYPDRDSVDYQEVIDLGGGHNMYIFSRGCPFGCPYCCNKALSQVYPDSHDYFRQRSPKKAIKEIEMDSQRFDFNYVVFNDDIICLNKDWFYEFFDRYMGKFDYPFRCNLRVGTVDDGVMSTLKQAGAVDMGVGLEQGNEDFRKNVLKRDMTNEQIVETFNLADKYGLSHYDFIMVGLPYENKGLFHDTVRLSRRVGARATISIFDPYPGTELYDVCRDNDWLPKNDDYAERVEAVISYPGFSAQEIQACADDFSLLTRFKFIPLNMPYRPLLGAIRFLTKNTPVLKAARVLRHWIPSPGEDTVGVHGCAAVPALTQEKSVTPP